MHNPFEPYELQFSQEERKKLIAKTIKELRTAKNLQQKELCEIMQIPQTTYNGYEKGRSEPPIEFLVRLSFFYGVDMNFITQRNFFNKTEADAFKNIAEQKIEIAKLKERLSQDNSRSDEETKAIIAALDGMSSLLDIAETKVPKAYEMLESKDDE